MTEGEYLDLEDLLGLVRAIGVGRVRDVCLLDSAAARPRSSTFGVDAYPTLEVKAAALLHSIARNHALVDGNQPLAWLATVVFLDLNRHATDLGDQAVVDLVMEAAQGNVEVDEIAARLRIGPLAPSCVRHLLAEKVVEGQMIRPSLIQIHPAIRI